MSSGTFVGAAQPGAGMSMSPQIVSRPQQAVESQLARSIAEVNLYLLGDELQQLFPELQRYTTYIWRGVHYVDIY